MKVVLVTGASGFIGSHLVPALAGAGYHVRATSRTPPSVSREGVEWIRVPESPSEADWTPLLEGVSYVVHLAGLAHQVDLRGDQGAEEFERANAFGTAALAGAVAQVPGIRRLVYVSSRAAVGEAHLIGDETPCSPTTPYGRSKLRGEQALVARLEETECDWVILRPPLVYGPGNPGNMARLLGWVRRGLPLPIAAIRNRRSFLFVGNCVDGVLHVLTHPEAGRRALNIADGEDVSTPDLVRRIGELVGKRATMFAVPEGILRFLGYLGDGIEWVIRRPFPFDSYAVERLCGTVVVEQGGLVGLGWKPPYSLNQGLARTLREDGAGHEGG